MRHPGLGTYGDSRHGLSPRNGKSQAHKSTVQEEPLQTSKGAPNLELIATFVYLHCQHWGQVIDGRQFGGVIMCHYSRQERLLASANRHGHNAKQLLLQELSSKANIIRLDIQHARLQTYHQIPQNVGKIVEILTQLHYGITDPQVGKPTKMHQKQKKYSSQL